VRPHIAVAGQERPVVEQERHSHTLANPDTGVDWLAEMKVFGLAAEAAAEAAAGVVVDIGVAAVAEGPVVIAAVVVEVVVGQK